MALTKTFGSVDTFRELLSNASVSVMGSGWGWLGYCPRTGQLRISSTPNQEPLDLPNSGLFRRHSIIKALNFCSICSYVAHRSCAAAAHRCVGARVLLAV